MCGVPVHSQQRQDKNKLYATHAPEVHCIAKGKAHKKYAFGNKVAIATTSKSNWIVGAISHTGNSYDGHTLNSSIVQVEHLTQAEDANYYCDLGYRGHDYRGKPKLPQR